VAADLWTKPTDLSHKPACRQLGIHIHHIHYYYSTSEANTHFITPWMVEG